MKRMLFTVLLVMTAVAGSHQAFAQGEEPTVYVVKKGDTLWGLSDRFIKDPYYWPNLWANNPIITNPHLIFPGEKDEVGVGDDRVIGPEVRPIVRVFDKSVGKTPKGIPLLDHIDGRFLALGKGLMGTGNCRHDQQHGEKHPFHRHLAGI